MRPFKICIIGCGGHSRRVHGPSCARYRDTHKDVVLAGCCDINSQAAESYRAQFGFQKSYQNAAEMISSENPDAVCVILPPDIAFHTVCDLLRSKCNVMMEKPIGQNLQQAEILAELAHQNGVVSQAAFNRRFVPLLNDLKRQLELESPKITYLEYNLYRSHRTEPCFAETAVHGIDAVQYLIASQYQHVHIQYHPIEGLGGSCNLFLDCEFKNGAVARLNFVPNGGFEIERATVVCINETFSLHMPIWDGYDTPGELSLIRDNTASKTLGQKDSMYITNGFYAEHCNFYDDIRLHRIPRHGFETCLQTMRLCEAIKHKESFVRFE